jgi:MtfA peptidase
MIKRFGPWIILFVLLLGSIPLFIIQEQIGIAKFVGFITVVGVSIALWIWRKQSQKLSSKKPRVILNLNDRFWLEHNIPFYKKLNKAEKKIFEDRVGLFLSEIIVTELDKEVPEKETCFYVASSAVIAYWGLPYWNYGELAEVLVYPQNYHPDGEIHQSGTHQGQVHHGGLMDTTMILSLRALKQGFDNHTDKKNVGVHEFTHLVDKHDGEIDGLPHDMEEEDEKLWMQLAEIEIAKIKKGKSDINPYGGTNHVEFFAVTVEYYKERPELFQKKHPRLYAILEEYFDEAE